MVLVDFNTPHSRDSSKLPLIAQGVAAAVRLFGERDAVVMAWMPNVSKEGSDKTPEEDEADIVQSFHTAGFLFQQRLRQLVTMHPSVAAKTSGMDWFIDGRLMCMPSNPKDHMDRPNFFMNPSGLGSELSRTKHIPELVPLPLTKDLVNLASLDPDEDINIGERAFDIGAKVAQRGPAVACVQLQALLNNCQLGPQDHIFVLDVLPWVGDRALGTHDFVKSSQAQGRGVYRHVICKCAGSANSLKQAEFTEQRVAQRLGNEWLKKLVVLHDEQQSATGGKTELAVFPNETVPIPTEDDIKKACGAGALAAFKGIGSMKFKALYIRGFKALILPDRLGAFATARLKRRTRWIRLSFCTKQTTKTFLGK